VSNDIVLMGGAGVLAVAVITGFIPVLATKLIVRLYPPGDARRQELVAELLVVPFHDRPAWVLQYLALGLTEGLSARRRAREQVLRGSSAMSITRTVDVLAALLMLVLMLPLLILVAVAIRLDSAGPVMFRQMRVGRNGKQFGLLKFRTMALGSEAPSWGEATSHSGGDPRVTRVGRWLRTSSLDELPQLWNVLMGQMSLVGPRPLHPGYTDFVGGAHEAILRARPGLTGEWQLSGDETLDAYERLNLRQAAQDGARQYVGVLSRTVVREVCHVLRGARQVVQWCCTAGRRITDWCTGKR